MIPMVLLLYWTKTQSVFHWDLWPSLTFTSLGGWYMADNIVNILCTLIISKSLWRLFFSGPAYYESLAVFPETTRIIVDTNLANSSVDIAQHEIQAAIQYIGWDRIYSIQRKWPSWFSVSHRPYSRAKPNHWPVGNEPDQYLGNQRPSNWTSTDYTDQFLVSPHGRPFILPSRTIVTELDVNIDGEIEFTTSNIPSRNLRNQSNFDCANDDGFNHRRRYRHDWCGQVIRSTYVRCYSKRNRLRRPC